jgi:hypothetical protein
VVLIRGALVVLAVAAGAWFVLGASEAHDVDAATAIVSSQNTITPAQARHADSLLSSASTLNPDQEIGVLRARVALGQGSEKRARQILIGVIHREPKLLDAWVWFQQASSDLPLGVIAAQVGIKRLVRLFPSSS